MIPLIAIALISVLLLAGCASKHVVRPAMTLEPACLTQPVKLLDCDSSEPPHCKKIMLDYKRGCEQVVAQ